jgi:hypothetical protein
MENYFQKQLNSANNEYSNYAGDWSYNGAQGYGNYPDAYQYANGAAAQRGPASLPFTIKVVNANTTDISNVSIFGAFKNTVGGTTNFGNVSGITITKTGTVGYGQFLEYLKSQPFKVGQFYIQTSNASQLVETITVKQTSSNNEQNQFPIDPVIDPNQNQSSVLWAYTRFVIDGGTELTTTLYASATVTYKFYPEQEIVIGRALVGESAERAYSKPGFSQIQLPSNRPLVGM